MSIQLQHPLADFFSATNVKDADALCALFAPGATVDDEGIQYRGLDSIRGWIAETVERYEFNVDVIDASSGADQASIVGVVSGDFAGSPVKVRYDFTLDREKIASLKVGA